MSMSMKVVASPIGDLLLVGNGRALTELVLSGAWSSVDEPSDGVLDEAARQLEAYFAGDLRDFDVPLEPTGTPFQLRVWHALLELDYGTTTSYGALAAELGKPTASRAVGAANGSNPIAIIIPCHRVIGAAGSLTGYGGGLERKRWLLDLEAGKRPLFRGPGHSAAGDEQQLASTNGR
jgi:methylated-DNA-[protein]-cysteine S-methyltransferase